jgi:RNA polymerase sigma factor (sigma-70 family)
MSDRVQRLLGVLQSHGGRIHTLLTRLTLCETTAEDLLQELFIRLSKSDSFDRARNHTAYAIRAAANLAFDWRQKQKRTISSHSLTDEPIAQDMSPGDVLENKERYARVLRALDGMSELSRQVIVLHRLQGESYDAIASQLDKTPHQVRAIFSKAIGQLRDLLGSSSSLCSEESK